MVSASKTKKVGLNMRSTLYRDLARLAKHNGQTITHVLEQAAEHYVRYVAPTQNTFHDGNKRVSFVATDAMLRANGYELNVDPDEAYRFIMDSIANREFQFPQIRDWLIAHVNSLEF